jgi:hypothetical protein
VITGDLAPDLQARAEHAGVRCLHKPIRPEALGLLVQEASRV